MTFTGLFYVNVWPRRNLTKETHKVRDLLHARADPHTKKGQVKWSEATQDYSNIFNLWIRSSTVYVPETKKWMGALDGDGLTIYHDIICKCFLYKLNRL